MVDRPTHMRFLLGAWRGAVQRLTNVVIILFSLVVITFFLVRLIPGDPAQRIAGADVSPEYLAALREQMGLNQPLWTQFATYVWRLLHGDLGTSFANHELVATLIASRLPFTLALAGTALLIVMAGGFSLGLIVAVIGRDNRAPILDNSFTGISGVVGAIPELIAAIGLTFVFAVELNWFPVSGANGWQAMVLPAFAISIRPMFNLSRVVRVEARNALQEDYMRTARSKRLPPFRLYMRHLLPNVATAALTVAGLLFPFLIGGTVVVENVFAWPGLGSTVVGAVISADYPVIQASILLLGIIVVVTNLGVDILIGLADPRRGAAQ